MRTLRLVDQKERKSQEVFEAVRRIRSKKCKLRTSGWSIQTTSASAFH